MGKEVIDGLFLARGVALHAPLFERGDGHQLCAQFVADARHLVLVLLAVEGAGAIDKVASRSQGGPNIAHDFPTRPDTLLHKPWRPLADGTLVLAKHPLARTRHVRGHNIEAALQPSEVGTIGIGHNHAGMAPFREVLGQNLRALPQRLVGNQKGIIGQERAPQRTLATRRSTKVEHTLRHYVHRPISLLDKHRRGLLHIECTSVEQGIGGKRRAIGEIRSRGTPRHGLRVGIEVLDRRFEGIAADADRGSRIQGLGQGLRLRRSKNVGHLLAEKGRKNGHRISFCLQIY